MKKSTKFLIGGFLSALLICGSVGGLAYATNWFKDSTNIENITKSGKVILSLKYDGEEGRMIDKKTGYYLQTLDNPPEAVDNAVGSQTEDNPYDLTTFKSVFSASTSFDYSNEKLSSVWDKVSSLDETYLSLYRINFEVSDEEEKGENTVAWFDTIRINFTVPTARYVCFDTKNAFGDLMGQKDGKYLPTGTHYVDLPAYDYDESEAVYSSIDEIEIVSLGLSGSQDTRLSIQSIECVAKGNVVKDKYMKLGSTFAKAE